MSLDNVILTEVRLNFVILTCIYFCSAIDSCILFKNIMFIYIIDLFSDYKFNIHLPILKNFGKSYTPLKL